MLSNHDVTRPVTRYGRDDSGFAFARKRFGTPVDLALGTRRARAAALLAAALPGSLYIYQGDELGLPEVENIPRDLLTDPMYFRSAGVDPGRDGCRVPLPWSGDRPPYGFGPGTGTRTGTGIPWLPQPEDWADLTVEAQHRDPLSMLSLYRQALRIRKSFENDGFDWLDVAPEALAFSRGDLVCVTNLGAATVALPPHTGILLASQPLVDGGLPTDSTVWLRTGT
jgi:alpha-glucosidase